MKKVTSAAVSAAMILGCTSAFAAEYDDYYAAMRETVYSAELEMTMSMSLDEISDELRAAWGLPDGDLKMDYLYSGAYSMSEDGKAIKMDLDMTMKIPGMEDVSVQTYLDMDLTDETAPKYIQIMKTPDEDKYMVMDYSKSSEMMAEIDSVMGIAYSEDIQKLAETLNSESMQKEPEFNNGVYSLVYTEQEIKDAVKELMLKGEDIYLPMLSSVISSAEASSEGTDISAIGGADGPADIYIAPADTEITDEDREQYRTEIEKWYEILNGVKLFADDAVTMDTELDENGSIKSMDMGINIDTNLYELISAVSGGLELTDEDIDPGEAGITKENSDIKASMSLNCGFSNVNGDVDVVIPEITEENSIDMLAGYAGSDSALVVNVETVDNNGTELLPLRSFCNEIGISNDDISYDNGVVTVRCSVNGVTEFIITINETAVTVTDAQGNARTEELDSPAVIINDRTYVTYDFASILGYLWSEDGFYNAVARAAGIS